MAHYLFLRRNFPYFKDGLKFLERQELDFKDGLKLLKRHNLAIDDKTAAAVAEAVHKIASKGMLLPSPPSASCLVIDPNLNMAFATQHAAFSSDRYFAFVAKSATLSLKTQAIFNEPETLKILAALAQADAASAARADFATRARAEYHAAKARADAPSAADADFATKARAEYLIAKTRAEDAKRRAEDTQRHAITAMAAAAVLGLGLVG